jgi:hypothetical protein
MQELGSNHPAGCPGFDVGRTGSHALLAGVALPARTRVHVLEALATADDAAHGPWLRAGSSICSCEECCARRNLIRRGP